MTAVRMDHVGIVVHDLAAATEFFTALGLVRAGSAELSGETVDRLHGLTGVSTEIVYLRTRDGQGAVELTRYLSPAPVSPGSVAPHTTGLRSMMFEVDDIAAVVSRLADLGHDLLGEVVQYEDSYRLCYVNGPDGIIVALAQPLTA